MRWMVWAAIVAMALCAGTNGAMAGVREAAEAFAKKDYTGVLSACKADAQKGDASCQNFLGILYSEGKGVKPDPAEAVRWFRLAAAQGNGYAATNLGAHYEKGLGVTKDLAEAKKWYRQAAEQGIAYAEFRLGAIIIETEQDMKQGVKWFRAAAAQGLPPAQMALGVAYELGQGARHSDALAAKWYEVAAEHGESGAQGRLAAFYERGQGVDVDLEEAYFWYVVALKDPRDPNRKRDEEGRKRVAAQLTKSQIANAERAVSDWHPMDVEIGKSSRSKRKASAKRHGQEPELFATGTGFFVSRAGHLLTNNHVVEGCSEMRVSGDGHTTPAKVIATDPQRDLALLQVTRASPTATFRDGKKLRPGENIVVVGFPFQGLLTSDPIVTTGIVSALAGMHNDRREIQISAPVQPGNSGGPVLDASGRIVGVVVAKLDSLRVARATGAIPENINFAVSGDEAQAFLREHRIKLELAPPGADLSTAAVADQALAVTVRLECWK